MAFTAIFSPKKGRAPREKVLEPLYYIMVVFHTICLIIYFKNNFRWVLFTQILNQTIENEDILFKILLILVIFQ